MRSYKIERYKGRHIRFSKIPNPPNYKIREPVVAEWDDRVPTFERYGNLDGYGFTGLKSTHIRVRGETKLSAFEKSKNKINSLEKWK